MIDSFFFFIYGSNSKVTDTTLYEVWERQGAEDYSQFLSVRGLLHSLQEQAGGSGSRPPWGRLAASAPGPRDAPTCPRGLSLSPAPGSTGYDS